MILLTCIGAISGNAFFTQPRSLRVATLERQYYSSSETTKSWEEVLKVAGWEGCSMVSKAPPIRAGVENT